MDRTLRTKLEGVAVATLATALFKRGLRNQVIQDVRPLAPKGRNMVGPGVHDALHPGPRRPQFDGRPWRSGRTRSGTGSRHARRAM